MTRGSAKKDEELYSEINRMKHEIKEMKERDEKLKTIETSLEGLGNFFEDQKKENLPANCRE